MLATVGNSRLPNSMEERGGRGEREGRERVGRGEGEGRKGGGGRYLNNEFIITITVTICWKCWLLVLRR